MNKNKKRGISIPLHQRLRDALSPKEWSTLEIVMLRIGSSSKSYARVTLLAMPDVEWRRVFVESKGAPKGTWRWEFRLIEGAP